MCSSSLFVPLYSLAALLISPIPKTLRNAPLNNSASDDIKGNMLHKWRIQ